MPFVSPFTVALVSTPLWSKRVLPNALDSDTSTSYEVARAELLQLRPSEDIGWLPAPFDGEARTGAAGAATMVVKLQPPDQPLIPPASFAPTRQ